MDYLTAIERALNIADVDLKPGAPARVVLVTDGELDNPRSDFTAERIAGIKDRLAESPEIRFFVIGIGVKNAAPLELVASESGGAYFSVPPGSDPAALYDWLGGALAGQIRISYLSGGLQPSDTAAINLKIAGSLAGADAEYIVPEAEFAAPAAIELHISSGETQISRTLIELGTQQAPWRLIGDYQIYIAPGSYPSDVVSGRYLENWLTAMTIGKAAPVSAPELPMSYAHVSVVNNHIGLTALALDNGQNPAFPAIYINKSAPGIYDDTVYQIRSLDAPRNGPWITGGAYDQNIRAGLAAGSAEAILLGDAQSPNARLSAQEDIERVSLEPINDIVNIADIVGAGNETDAWDILLSKSRRDVIWALNRKSGNIYPIDLSYAALGKGTNVAEIARKFDEIDKLLEAIGKGGGVGISAMGAPYSQPFAALIGLFRTQNKMWCYATVMMGYVGNAIEDEEALLNQSTEAAEAKAKELCKMDFEPEDFDKAMTQSIAEEWAKAWASDVIGSGIQNGVSSAAGFGRPTGPGYGWHGAAETAWNGVPGSTASVGAGVSSGLAAEIVDFVTARSAPAPIPMTPGFHNAMSAALNGPE